MLTSERREKKQGKIRNSEYYGMESIFDTLYAESRNGKTFNHLTVTTGNLLRKAAQMNTETSFLYRLQSTNLSMLLTWLP